MSRPALNLKRSWFGVDPREAKRYLRQMEAIMNAEAERLEEEIRQEKAVRERLRRELEQMKEAVSEEPDEIEPGLMDTVRERLGRSIEAIRRQGEAESDSLLGLLRERERQKTALTEEAGRQMEHTRQSIDRLLGQALDLVIKLKGNGGELPLEEKDIQEALAVLAAPAELPGEEEERLEEERSQESAESRFQQGANVIQFRLRTFLSKLEAAEASQREAVTSDGAAAPAASGAEARSGAYSTEFRSAPPVSVKQMPIPVIRPVERERPKIASPFWGDLDDYLGEQTEILEWRVSEEPGLQAEGQEDRLHARRAAEPLLAQATAETAAAAEPRSAEPRSAETQYPSPRGEGAGPADGPDSTAAGRSSRPEGSESPALAQEIRSIQQRYIVGKAAGENLYADNGKLIAAKGTIITPETIEAAEQAGKLADLIVQMVIPGMTESV